MPPTIANELTLRERLRYAISRSRGVRIETDLAPYRAVLAEVRSIDYSRASDQELQQTARRLRREAQERPAGDAPLASAFALVAEAGKRTLGLRAYDEQVLAGIVLHRGKLAEMQTGEGKTLAAVFPTVLDALSGRGVHVMTANDYLARRDAQWMGPLYRFLGLRAGFVQARMAPSRRRAAYAADVTYLTAREAGFDLLRDGLAYDPAEIVQRGFHYAIIDEADCILIDEARVPLVIAGRGPDPEVDPRTVDSVVGRLRREVDFQIDRFERRVFLTPQGQARVEELLHCGGMHQEEHLPTYAAVHVALHAHHLLRRDVDYIVRRGQVELVDEFTGRVAQRRRWPYGIQPALEAKEGLEIRPEGRIYGSLTTQHLVGLYPKVAAMTATAVSAAPELAEAYGLDTVLIPTHRPVIRVDAPDRVYATAAEKTAALLAEIAIAHAAGRPVLVGTRSVRESQGLAGQLRRRGIPCQVLNARNDHQEARLVARAGMLGAVTISTNMAGRGTDIRLGGPDGAQHAQVAGLGGLYVIGTSRCESRRVDRQLRGRAGRQGDPGGSCFFLSLEDPLFEKYGVREFLPRRLRQIGPGGVIGDRRVSREIARAQSILANQNWEIRRTLRRYSELVERQRRRLQEARTRALARRLLPEELLSACRLHLELVAHAAGRQGACDILVRFFLSVLDRFWADHLLYVDVLKEGIHLQHLGGEEPLRHFIREVSEAFDRGAETALREAAEGFNALEPGSWRAASAEARASGVGGTWTYLINDDPIPGLGLGLVSGAGIGAAAAAAALAALPALLAAPFVVLRLVLRRVQRLKPRRPVSESPG